jgi:hypothetical protein
MSRIRRISILSLWVILLPCCCTAQIKHFGLTETDRFQSCAAKIFGKPVLISPEWAGTYNSVACVQTIERLKKTLVSKGVSVFQGPQFVYLIPSASLQRDFGIEPGTPSISWAPANGERSFTGCDPLSDKALLSVGETILVGARMPLFPAGLFRAASDGRTLEAKLVLKIYDCHLGPSIESVFGVLGGTRLVYGEMKGGQFVLLWDSAEFPFGYVAELKDINGDGVKEILVSYDASGAAQADRGLAIFDIHGTELDPGDESFVGEDFEYQTRPDGCLDVLVINGDRTDRYTLVNGRYQLKKPSSLRERHAPADTAAH